MKKMLIDGTLLPLESQMKYKMDNLTTNGAPSVGALIGYVVFSIIYFALAAFIMSYLLGI